MLTADQVVDTYFLDVRCMLLEIAATLDRHDRATDGKPRADTDPEHRWTKVYEALDLIAARGPSRDRAERLLNLFSDVDGSQT